MPGQRAVEEVQEVRTVDIARWLKERFCAADQVYVKMDIEGAEFEVLEHLLDRGAAVLLDNMSIEWHTAKRGFGAAAKLQRRQAAIIRRLRRAGVRMIEWTV